MFRTIFRGSGWSFANDPDFMHVSKDPKYWDSINEKFFSKYSGIDECHNQWWKVVQQDGQIVGPTGRTWTINIERDYKGNLKIPWTTLSNYPVQGTSADVMMIARISFAKRLKASGIPALLVATVHDNIVVDVPDEYIQEVVNLFHQVFDDLPANMSRTFKMDWNVPLGCEVKYGRDMKNMNKIHRTDK